MISEKSSELSPTEKHRLRELEQEVEIMGEYISLLSNEKNKNQFTDLAQNSKSIEHEKKESEQEKLILMEINKSLEKKTEFEISQFLEMISHELKTPLTPIKAYAEMLAEEKFGNLGETQKQKLKKIDDNTRELIQLITNLSGYQKFSLGKGELKLESVDIKKIIHEAHLFFSSELDAHGMKINSTFSKPLWVMCDATLIFQVFTNLLQLAFYTISKKTGKIIVNVWEKENDVEITLSHNEKIITQELLNKIFSKFYTVDTSKIRSNGGIGLAIVHCKQIIESHGGKIWSDDKIQDFTSIKFTLPKKVEITKS